MTRQVVRNEALVARFACEDVSSRGTTNFSSVSFLLMESAMWGQQKGILNRHNKCGDLGFKAQTMESGQELKEGIRMNLPTTNSGDSNEIFPAPTTPGRFEYS
jgi:hypothetical protein